MGLPGMDPENLNSGTPPKTEMKNSAVKTIGQFFFLKIQEKRGDHSPVTLPPLNLPLFAILMLDLRSNGQGFEP